MIITTEILKQTISSLQMAALKSAPQATGTFEPAKQPLDGLTRSLMGRSTPTETSQEIANLEDALSHISSDVGRGNGSIFDMNGTTVDDYWIGVIWAGASLGWSCGKEIFRKWSMKSTRYTDDGFEKAWNSYDPNKLNAIGIGSLYKLAKLKGWNQYPVYATPNPTHAPSDPMSISIPILDTTDAGNAIWLNRCLEGRVRWIRENNRWLCFDDYSGWVEKADEEMLQIAEQGLRRLGQAGYSHFNGDELKALNKHVTRSLNAAPLSNALTLLKGQLGVIVSQNELNRDPMLLGVNDGFVVDLRTGLARKQIPEDLITKHAAVDYDDNAKCPLFEAFLLSIFQSDKDLIDFVQRWFGYVLTGLTDEQQILFGHGRGANGKSVLFSIVTELLGTYAVSAPIETFMISANNDGPKSHLLARLAGARLALANETADGQRLAENLIKEMTGGERIASAHKYGHVFEYRPTFKLAIVGNHKPVIKGTDDGIWRRLQLLPFLRTFQLHEQDPKIKEKLMDELSGILNWAIAGCLAWQKEGRLNMPPVMQKEVSLYRSESDVIGQWIEECCISDPVLTTSASSLYFSYKQWCERNGHKASSQTTLGRRLGDRGFMKKRGVKSEWGGIGFRQNDLFNS